MHFFRSGSDVRYECHEGHWYGFVIVPRDELQHAKRRYVTEGRHYDAPIPNSRDRIRLQPLDIIDVRGLGEPLPGAGELKWAEYELKIVYGRR